MSEPSFREFLDASLHVLPGECPAAFAALVGALSRCAIDVSVGAERFAIRCDGQRVSTLSAADALQVEAVTDRRTLLDVIGARLTLLEAVATDRLRLRGRPDDLLRFHDAWVAFVAGAVRSPSFPGLLARFEGEETAPDIASGGTGPVAGTAQESA